MSERAYRVKSPVFPTYLEVRNYMQFAEGVSRSAIRQLIQDIWDQTGTPQNPVDWTDPDTWIGERLSGESARLARRLWEKSDKTLNPRHMYGSYLFANLHALLAESESLGYGISERGRAFLDGRRQVVQEIDRIEGLDELLSILSTKGRAMRGDLLPEWGDFLRENSKFGTPSTIKDTLRRRLVNLVERGLVDREGNSYSISSKGRDYLGRVQVGPLRDSKREVNRAIAEHNKSQRALLRERLASIDPVRFEKIVRDLLEAMGYEDVQVTRQSGDKGVDVVGTVQFGITTVTEVVQVKRHKGSIRRPIVDQLRGALPYHEAIRGTIITLGRFSRGSKEAALYPGAAPITLIDGDRLIDLLVEHEVAVTRRPTPLFEIDEGYLEEEPTVAAQPDEGEDEHEPLAVNL